MQSTGITKTKVGPGSKRVAFVVPIGSLLKILVCTAAVFGLAVYACVRARSTLWEEQHKLEDARQNAIEFGHDAAVNLLRIGVELEAHLKLEKEWGHNEEMFMERARELEETHRFLIMKTFHSRFDEFSAELNAVLPAVVALRVEEMISKHRGLMFKGLDTQVAKFGIGLDKLNSGYLKTITTEADRASDRLQFIHDLVQEASISAGVGDLHTIGDDLLDFTLKKFFVNAKDKIEDAQKMDLPGKTIEKIIMYLDDFERQNADQVLESVSEMLFPSGKNEGESVHGAPHYKGGSVEAYLEEILYLDHYKKKVWPTIMLEMGKWESMEHSGPQTMEFVNGMVLNNSIPALWLMP